MTAEMIALGVLVIVVVAMVDGVHTAWRVTEVAPTTRPKALTPGDPGPLGTQKMYR